MNKLLIGLGVGLLALIGVGLVAVAYVAGTYNQLVQAREQVPAQWSQVENVLQRRNDLIPNLVGVVKGYAAHEQSVYGDVSKALAAFSKAQTVSQKIAADNTITGLLSKIMTISLQYPEIKADAQFTRLSDELAGTENRIAVERMRFNQTVQAYNTLVKTFPTNVIANFTGFKPAEDYFKADKAANVAPKVAF